MALQYTKIESGKSKKNKVFRIGVVGYSAQKFDKDTAKKYISNGISELSEGHESKDVEIVSGLTDLGIPALAYREAQKRGMKTVGIACEQAKDYECFDVDKKFLVGKNWGDESKKFLSYCDALLRVGGGKQSLREVEIFKSFKDKGHMVMEFELKAEV